MYKGFDLKLILSEDEIDQFYSIGKNLFDARSFAIILGLTDLLLTNDKVNGSKMQEIWFPQMDADVFISHSHNDERTAIALAGWFKSIFNINSFIDSCIWGHSDNLLKAIDRKLCLRDDGYYSYEKEIRRQAMFT